MGFLVLLFCKHNTFFWIKGVVKQRDAERERLRKELHRLREQCHEKNSLHGHVEDNTSTLDSIQSGDLESIEVRMAESNQLIHDYYYFLFVAGKSDGKRKLTGPKHDKTICIK